VRILLYDTTAGWLSTAWRAGASLGRFDRVVGVSTPAESYAAIRSAAESPGGLDEVQIWGHGSPGAPVIDGERLYTYALGAALRPSPVRSLVWFRSCAVFAGAVGQSFAADLAALDVRVAGHTRVIGAPWQSGLYALRPGQVPHWSALDGGGSGPFLHHTILVTRMSLPDWAYGEGQ
jgi:hypothetical protein